MSALFNFEQLLIVLLLMICTCAYLHQQPMVSGWMDGNKAGFSGTAWKFARIGAQARGTLPPTPAPRARGCRGVGCREGSPPLRPCRPSPSLVQRS